MTNAFKQYERNRRQTTLEQDFSMGMMFNGGTVDFSYAKMLVNYNTYNDRNTLVPRAGLQLSGLILPDFDMDSFDSTDTFTYHGTDVTIKDAKECVEADGVTYKQFILGRSNSSAGDGRIYVLTSPEETHSYVSSVIEDFSLNLSVMNQEVITSDASYLVTDLDEIHGMQLKADSKVSSLIGCFAFGNSYYFINPTTKKLCKTKFNDINKRYELESLTPKNIDPSEAVTYGYNMLLGESAYNFTNSTYAGNIIQLTGILPYDSETGTKLLMSPKKNQDITFKCFCKVPASKSYKFIWEWRTVEDGEWTQIADTGVINVTSTTDISVTFKPPTTDIMLRVQAYESTDLNTVEKAMTVGFDFSLDGEVLNINPECYDLTTATGLTYWKNRLVMWGVAKDPTILFVSDVNEPTYFPYPNNISVFDEPIVSVKTYMDSLLVFTTSQVYQVSLAEDGVSWTSTLLQSNLYIQSWDRHLIQVVRNMVFFKSGNYFYMIVPKAQSTTGELTLAPVSTPIVEFFNGFEKNVAEMLHDVFDYKGEFSLVHYYNFLDYEYVHNIYVLDYTGHASNVQNYLHLDVMYNTVSRSWKIHTFDAPHFLYPYKNDATQTGTLAATSLIKIQPSISAQNATLQIEEPLYNMYSTNLMYIKEDIDLVTLFSAPTLRIHLGDKRIDFSTVGATASAGEFIFTNATYKFVVPSNGKGAYLQNLSGFDSVVNSLIFEFIGEIESVVKTYTTTPQELGLVRYGFADGFIKQGTIVEINNVRYQINASTEGWMYNLSYPEVFKVKNNIFMFPEGVSFIEAPIIKAYNTSEEQNPVTTRCIQLYNFNGSNMNDIFLPTNSEIVFDVDALGDTVFKYSTGSISYAILDLLNNSDDYFRFKNWQFLDTGYREDNLHLNKRYRELQLQLNNIDGANLEFSMEFKLNGTTRRRYYMYEVEQVLDQDDPDYGLLSIQSTPYSNVILKTESVLNETTLATFPEQEVEELDTWHLNQSKFPGVNLWRVRMHISGKGQAPRLRLLSKNPSKFELMGINWVYRVMNMR